MDCFEVIWNLIMLSFPAGLLVFFSYEASVFIPAISRAYNYVPASMTVRHTDFLSQYCCNLVCFCDEVDDGRAEQCAAMQSRSQSLSPLLCTATNASSCPPSGSAAVCNDGPFCCTSCNQTCSYSQAPIVCKCPCQECSTCSCCKHVEARLCRLFCDSCFKVNTTLNFKDRNGVPRSGNILYEAGSNLRDAQDFYNARPENSTFLGFYKPSDPSIVHVSRGYRVRKWAAFIMLSGLPFFLIGMALTGCLIALVVHQLQGRVSVKVVFWANWVLWVGIIWPFLILLLILELGYPTPRAKIALRALIVIIAFIGWFPVILLLCIGGMAS